MALFTVENVTFKYDDHAVLQDVSFSIEKGQFVALCGLTGSGKSTLLRLLKKELQPVGQLTGTITFNDKPLSCATAHDVSFVMQKPDEQLVMEQVWQELAFPLENEAIEPTIMEQKIAEVTHFLGIHHLFYKRTADLSGGQKQLVNLAAALMTNPKALLLDEPTAQLDPLAATHFIQLLERIHRELGMTIIIVEHRLEELVSIVDKVLILEAQTIAYDEAPQTLLPKLKQHPLLQAFGAAPYIYSQLELSPVALTVRDAKRQLPKVAHSPYPFERMHDEVPILTVRDLYFRYERKGNDILKNAQLSVAKGQMLAIVGSNGAGKSTLLHVLAGLKKAYKGKVIVTKDFPPSIALLPQNAASLFMKQTVLQELEMMRVVSDDHFEQRKETIIDLLELRPLLQVHPDDLSGGQQQLVAFAKVYCLHSDIVLLDEPTKGLDMYVKAYLQKAIEQLLQEQVAIITVTHDLDFAARVSSHCTMLFQGKLTPIVTARQFFTANSYYTTSARRIASEYYHSAINSDELIQLIQQGAKTYA